jgi:hypothetical protein
MQNFCSNVPSNSINRDKEGGRERARQKNVYVCLGVCVCVCVCVLRRYAVLSPFPRKPACSWQVLSFTVLMATVRKEIEANFTDTNRINVQIHHKAVSPQLEKSPSKCNTKYNDFKMTTKRK